MIESDVIVTTKHGRMPTFMAAPDGPEQYPGIIFYMDAPGIREELRNMARRIAKHGYVCLLPDMYYRLGTVRFDIPRRDDGMSGVIRASMNSLTIPLRQRRHGGDAGLVRRERPGEAGAGRLRRALHERALYHIGGGGISAPHGRGSVAVRRAASSPTRRTRRICR